MDAMRMGRSEYETLDTMVVDYLKRRGLSQGVLHQIETEVEGSGPLSKRHKPGTAVESRLVKIFQLAVNGHLQIKLEMRCAKTTLGGCKTTVDLKSWSTVLDVKTSVELKLGIPVGEQRLMHQTHELTDDSTTLAACSITPDNCTLSVVRQRRNLALSASDESDMKLWSLNESRVSCLKTFTYRDEVGADLGHAHQISADWSRMRALTCTNEKLSLWNLETGWREHTFDGRPAGEDLLDRDDDISDDEVAVYGDGHRLWILSLAVDWGASRALTGSLDKTLKLWDLDRRESLRTFVGHRKEVTCVVVNVPDMRAVSASGDRTLKLWDLSSGDCIRTYRGHTDRVLTVSVGWTAKRALSASRDSILKMWDLETGACLQTYEEVSIASKLAVDWVNMRALFGDTDGSLKVWDLVAERCSLTLNGHSEAIRAIAVDWSTMRAFSSSADATIKFWDIHTGQCLQTLDGSRDAIFHAVDM